MEAIWGLVALIWFYVLFGPEKKDPTKLPFLSEVRVFRDGKLVAGEYTDSLSGAQEFLDRVALNTMRPPLYRRSRYIFEERWSAEWREHRLTFQMWHHPPTLDWYEESLAETDLFRENRAYAPQILKSRKRLGSGVGTISEKISEDLMESDSGILFLSDTCPTCESVSSSGFVTCNRCDAKMHRDCWEMVGKCNTYGCRGRYL